MSGEFERIRVEAIVTHMKIYSTFYIYMFKKKNRDVAGHCGYPAYNSFEWHDLAASPVVTYGNHHSTSQNAYILGLRGMCNK
jgi:hypothetical protein